MYHLKCSGIKLQPFYKDHGLVNQDLKSTQQRPLVFTCLYVVWDLSWEYLKVGGCNHLKSHSLTYLVGDPVCQLKHLDVVSSGFLSMTAEFQEQVLRKQGMEAAKCLEPCSWKLLQCHFYVTLLVKHHIAQIRGEGIEISRFDGKRANEFWGPTKLLNLQLNC